MVPGGLAREGILVPEPCLGSVHLSWISVEKQGWGPSKMTLVPSQESGYFPADGDDAKDGVGA